LRRGTQAELPRLFVTQLIRGDIPEGSDEAQEKGLKKAKALRKHGRSYVLDDFHWSANAPFRKGDKVIQVTKEADGHRLIDAPADVINTHRWVRDGRGVMFIYLERPKVRRVSVGKLAKKFGRGAKKKLHRNGLVRNRDFAETLLRNWTA
jgi:hypothetical protein